MNSSIPIMDKNFQQIFLSSLVEGYNLPKNLKIVSCRGLALKEAWEIYQNNYYQNLQKSLAQTYEACAALLTKEIFEKLSFAFIRQYPLKQSDLAVYGEEFPSFLENAGTITASWPFLVELALLESVIKKLFLYGHTDGEVEISYPVHQIWQSLLYDGEEIEDFDGKKLLTIHKNDEERLFFDLREVV